MSAADKAVERLRASIEGGDLYQALQLFKTQHARAKKKGDVTQALELAFRGANLMLEKKEVNSGSELARDFLDLLKEQPEFNNDKVLAELLLIEERFRALDGEEASREGKRFIKGAIDLTAERGPWPAGDPALHWQAALMALKESDVLGATKHMLHAHRPEEFASTVAKWAKVDRAEDADLYLARAVLQLLCLENLRDANAFNKAYRAEFPDMKSPLAQFIEYLLKVLERDAYPLFVALRQKYAPAISRGNTQASNFDAYLDKIASVFFGVAPAKSGMASMMESLMKGLF